MKKIIILLSLTIVIIGNCFAQEKPGPEAAALLERISKLDNDGKSVEALTLLDQGLKTFLKQDYDRFFILNYKCAILIRQNRNDEAIVLAEEKANIIKSPKQALFVADLYLKLKNSEKALDWIKTSVDRGLQTYTIFDNKDYDPIREIKEFSDQIEIVKKRNGLGLPAKPFDRESISGEKISLNTYKGKVLLIDFWATFCGPCIKEMPNLKQCYNQFNEDGFEIIGFSEDKNINQLKKYLDNKGIGWDIVICPNGNKDETISLYEVNNIPASFLVDRKGIVRYVNLTGDDLKNAIKKLVDE